MTTKHSPLNVLKRQADAVAAMLKAAERGERHPLDKKGELVNIVKRETFTIGVAMDDKVLQIPFTREKLITTGEVALSEYLLKLMREERNNS